MAKVSVTKNLVTVDTQSTVVSIDANVAVGAKGEPGVIAATAPATYNAATQTIGVTTGTTSGTVAAGNDSRFTDGRPPNYVDLIWSTDANYTIVATQSAVVQQTGTLTNPRTITLPAASALPAGSELIVQIGGSATATNTVTIQRPSTGAGSTDTINGSASNVVIAVAWGMRRFITDGASSWVYDAGVLRISNNLSELTSTASTARTNLGLGALATKATAAPTDLAIGTATTSGNTPSTTAADKIVSASSTASSQSIGTTMPTGGFAVDKVVDSWSDPFAHAKSSECATMPRLIVSANLTISSGTAYGSRAVYTGNQPSHTFTQLRCAVSATGASVTKFVMFIADSTGTTIAYTPDTTGITAGAMTIGIVTGNITAVTGGASNIVLTPGAVYYLGFASVFGTSPAPRGITSGAGITALTPIMTRTGSSYTTGYPSTLPGAGSTVVMPWVELI
jgi:hypothetical protein